MYRVLFFFASLLIGGCSDNITYRHTQFVYSEKTKQVEKAGEVYVHYTRNAGNSQRETIFACIGDKENPEAILFVGKSTVVMDEFYKFWSEMAPELISLLRGTLLKEGYDVK
jgi:hypothetical protein